MIKVANSDKFQRVYVEYTKDGKSGATTISYVPSLMSISLIEQIFNMTVTKFAPIND